MQSLHIEKDHQIWWSVVRPQVQDVASNRATGFPRIPNPRTRAGNTCTIRHRGITRHTLVVTSAPSFDTRRSVNPAVLTSSAHETLRSRDLLAGLSPAPQSAN